MYIYITIKPPEHVCCMFIFLIAKSTKTLFILSVSFSVRIPPLLSCSNIRSNEKQRKAVKPKGSGIGRIDNRIPGEPSSDQLAVYQLIAVVTFAGNIPCGVLHLFITLNHAIEFGFCLGLNSDGT